MRPPFHRVWPKLAVVGIALFGAWIASDRSVPSSKKSANAPAAKHSAARIPGRTSEPAAAARHADATQQVLDAYAKLPLMFLENGGHVDAAVRYHAQGPGYGFFFTPEEVVMSFTERAARPRSEAGLSAVQTSLGSAPRRRGTALALRFLGARRTAGPEGRLPVPGHVNYLIGRDPAQWRRELGGFGELVYRELWPGVDLVVRGGVRELKYEFLIRPGGRVEDIRLEYLGANRLSLDSKGNLRVETPLGALTDSRPVSYQWIEGERVAVDSRYVLAAGENGRRYGFSVGTGYRPGYPLVVDPGLLYATFLGGTSDEGVFEGGIAVDAEGNAYVTGVTTSPDFPVTRGAFDLELGGRLDAFVTKLNADGSALVYSTFLGGEEFDEGADVAVDARGHAYVTGSTLSREFPTTPGAFDTRYSGIFTNGFVTKLTRDGTGLVYSTFLGGDGVLGAALAIGTGGEVSVTGSTFSRSFPTTPGAFDRTLTGRKDAFVTLLDPAGSSLIYSTFLGGHEGGNPGDADDGNDVAVDADGNVYVTGATNARDFPTTPGAFDRTGGGLFRDEVFVTKLDPTGSTLVYSTFVGESDFGGGRSLALDAEGNAYVTGLTFGGFPTTPGAFDTTFNGDDDAFVTKLNATGSALVFSTYLGGTDLDAGFGGIAVDPRGNAHVTGFTTSKDFPTTPGAFDTSLEGRAGAFVTELNAAGSALLYSTYVEGAFGDDLALDAAGDAYITGGAGADLPATPGAFDVSFNGESDAFVAKLRLVPDCGGRAVTILGSEDDDVLTGTAADDVIAGLGGNDGLDGLGGNDVICGGDGNDTLLGSSGDDKLIGERGDDHLFGASGADLLLGNAGDDRLNGDTDNDSLKGGDGNDFLLGGDAFDSCEGQGGAADIAFGCERVRGVP